MPTPIWLVIWLIIILSGCQPASEPVAPDPPLTMEDREILEGRTPSEPTREAIYIHPGAGSHEAEIAPTIVTLKSLTADKAIEAASAAFPTLGMIRGPSPRLLIVHGPRPAVEKAQGFLRELDRPAPQILIESQIIEVADSGLKELGLSWGSLPGVFQFSYSTTDNRVTSKSLEATLSTLLSQGKANMLARPRITTTENEEAVINIGNRIPYAVPAATTAGAITWAIHYIDAGVKLRITPRVGDGGLITAKIQPEVSTISEWRTTPAGEFPVISTRNADTQLQIQNGETIVIGGLISETERDNISKLALLGDAPLIGPLFQRRTTEKTKSDILFLIRPKLL